MIYPEMYIRKKQVGEERRLLGGKVQGPPPKITDTDLRSNYQTLLSHGFGSANRLSSEIQAIAPIAVKIHGFKTR